VLPYSLGIVPRGGDTSREIVVTVRAQDASRTTLVSRRIETSFPPGRTVLLDVFLGRACLAMPCVGDTTCVGGTCIPAHVDAATLPDLVPGSELDVGLRPDAPRAPDTGPVIPWVCDVGGACDVITQGGCAGDTRCYYSRAGAIFTAQCLMSSGAVALGEPCLGNTSCGGGMFCDTGSDEPANVCIAYCCAASECPAGQRCSPWVAETGDLPMGGCFPDEECDALARTGCPPTEACYFRRAYTYCALPGTRANDATCRQNHECVPGDMCMAGTDGIMRCMVMCDLRAPVCPAGRVCASSNALAPYDHIGACR
jgi:hypothetical protein